MAAKIPIRRSDLLAGTPRLVRYCAAALADLVFPRNCVHCSDLVEGPDYDYLCRDCGRELVLARSPSCRTCGYPFWGALAGQRSCPHCEELDPVFDEGRTLFLAKGPGRSLIHEIKYRRGFYVLTDVTRILAWNSEACAYLRDAVLVPVPLHPVKERERGFNQSEVIARRLARAVPGARTELLLRRVRFTESQTRLNRTDRHRNVKNAFALASGVRLMPHLSYVLVDDVFTTGSTLNACAATLREAGARSLKVLTLGHG